MEKHYLPNSLEKISLTRYKVGKSLGKQLSHTLLFEE